MWCSEKPKVTILHDDHTPVAVSSVGLTALVRLAELSEWVDVMDAALEYRRRQFGARQKRSVLSSLEQKEGGVSEVLKVLTLEDTRHLMVVYLNKVCSTARATQIVDGSSHCQLQEGDKLPCDGGSCKTTNTSC